MSAPAPMRGSAPFLEIAPPLGLPLRHFALAPAAFLAFASAVLLGADRLTGWGLDARFALGAVHVATLGWVAQAILGAWCQMIPVHGGTPLRAPRRAALAWWVFSAGAAAFVAALWSGSERYWIPGAAVLSGLILYLSVLVPAHLRAARKDAAWVHFAAAMAWLAVLGVLGLLMAYDRQRGLLFRDPEGGLIAHVHAALVGFVGTTIYGAGHRLFPWVALEQARARWKGWAAFFCTQAGLAGLVLDALFLSRGLMPLWSVLIVAGFVLYASQGRPMGSLRRAPDPSTALVLLAGAGAALWAALGLGLGFGLLEDGVAERAAYVWTALAGCVSPVILAQARKIAPFLVWLHVYSPREWTPPAAAPKIDDLTRRRLGWAQWAGAAAALPLGAAAFLLESVPLLRAAGACLTVAAACCAVELGGALRHAWRPDPRWTAYPRARSLHP